MSTPKEAWDAAVAFAAAKRTMPDDSETQRQWSLGFHDSVGRDILTALAERGYRIVPEDPTPVMTKAAAKAMSPGKRPTEEWVSACEKHAYRYMAMLAAAPVFPPEETRD